MRNIRFKSILKCSWLVKKFGRGSDEGLESVESIQGYTENNDTEHNYSYSTDEDISVSDRNGITECNQDYKANVEEDEKKEPRPPEEPTYVFFNRYGIGGRRGQRFEIRSLKHFTKQAFHDATLMLEKFRVIFDIVVPVSSVYQAAEDDDQQTSNLGQNFKQNSFSATEYRRHSADKKVWLVLNNTKVMIAPSYLTVEKDTMIRWPTRPQRSLSLNDFSRARQSQPPWYQKPKTRCPVKFVINGEPRCTVCYEPFYARTELRKLPCGHVMHDLCVRQWLFREMSHHDVSFKRIVKKEVDKFTCPCCRFNVFRWVFDDHYKPSFAKQTVANITAKTSARLWKDLQWKASSKNQENEQVVELEELLSQEEFDIESDYDYNDYVDNRLLPMSD